MSLEDKRIIVTGGARGIGAACLRTYVAVGARVASFDILDDLGRAEAEAASKGQRGQAEYYHCDISRRADVEAAFDQAVRDLGGLDVLAHIAGVEMGGPAENPADEEWTSLLEVNVRGTMLTNQVAFEALRSGGGRIINVGSDAGLAGFPGLAAYGATKAAVMAWTRNLASEWGRYGISVNAVIPGMWTAMYEGFRSSLTKEELAQHDEVMARSIPLGGRLGDLERDLAPVMVFLASEGSQFITGQIIAINGGLGMVR